jgi:uncharacterized protein
MKCPVDGIDLVMSDRQGIEIDYCPQCRGVWLDRGEIDKIIERSVGQGAPASNYPQQQSHSNDNQRYTRRDDDHDDYRRREEYGHDQHNQKRHKKESFFSELFD